MLSNDDNKIIPPYIQGVEIWKNIPGFERYLVSNLGRVRSPFKILNPWKDDAGYSLVSISNIPNKFKKIRIHRLVAMAFLGKIPRDKEVAHNDGSKSNNNLSNLRICSRKENHADKLKHGTDYNGPKSSNAKFTWEQIREIRNSKNTRQELALKYGVHENSIGRIINNVRYRQKYAP